MEDFRKKNKQAWDTETPMRIDEDLNQESVTDAMRGDNNVPHQEPQKKKAPADSE
jgi:hypothetical protein